MCPALGCVISRRRDAFFYVHKDSMWVSSGLEQKHTGACIGGGGGTRFHSSSLSWLHQHSDTLPPSHAFSLEPNSCDLESGFHYLLSCDINHLTSLNLSFLYLENGAVLGGLKDIYWYSVWHRIGNKNKIKSLFYHPPSFLGG